MTYLAPGLQIALLLIVIPAAIFDVRSRRIPNWLVLIGLVLGFGLNSFLYGTSGLKTAGLGFVLAFAIYFVLYVLHAMGAGDAKLMGAVGSIVGPGNWFGIFIITAILGGVAALGLLLARRRLRTGLWNVFYILGEMSRLRAPYMSREELDVRSPKSLRLPHGLTIAAGSAAFLLISRVLARF